MSSPNTCLVVFVKGGVVVVSNVKLGPIKTAITVLNENSIFYICECGKARLQEVLCHNNNNPSQSVPLDEYPIFRVNVGWISFPLLFSSLSHL